IPFSQWCTSKNQANIRSHVWSTSRFVSGMCRGCAARIACRAGAAQPRRRHTLYVRRHAVIAEQQHERPRPTVAIVGSGPSGCYTAEFLRKELPDAEITIFEALPVPYGLVRYGVAADHQGTKAVAAQFDRMFDRGNITFVGNTRIGVDIAFEAITDSFD